MSREHVIPLPELKHNLNKWGYFGLPKTEPELETIDTSTLENAIGQYQMFHGLSPDGYVGPYTAHQMNRLRCGLPDMEMRADAKLCAWPMKRVTYLSQVTMPGMQPVEVAQAMDVACSQWNAICGIQLVPVNMRNQANIFSQSGTGRANGLDGRGGTLAWSELPCNARNNSQMQQMYDQAERWSFSMAVAVFCHEIGHACGLPHLSSGNLMAPYYDPQITRPQSGDISAMVQRYGQAAPVAPGPAPTPPQTPNQPPATPGQPAPNPTPTPGGPVVNDVSGVILINGSPFVLVPRL